MLSPHVFSSENKVNSTTLSSPYAWGKDPSSKNSSRVEKSTPFLVQTPK
jgi:hypothetical protein